MTAIVIHEFGGMQPRIGDEFLATEAASDAENCLLLSGELRPLHAPSLLNIFYPGNSHQRNTDLFQPPLEAPLEGSLDTFVETTYGSQINVWIKGINGVNNDASTGSALANPTVGFTGIDPFVAESDPLVFAGRSLDSAGGRGFNMQHIPVPGADYSPNNPSRGILTILADPDTVPEITLQGLGEASFDEKEAVTNRTGSRRYIQYSVSLAIVEFTAGGPGSVSVGVANGTHSFLSGNLNSPSASTLYTPGLDTPGGQTPGTWSVAFQHNPSETLGVFTVSRYNVSITGHPGGIWDWDNPQFPMQSRYTFHMLFRWVDNTSSVQAFFRTQRGATFSGVEIYYRAGALWVQHGEFDRVNLGLVSLVEGQDYQLIVTYDRPAQIVYGYLNGALVGSGSIREPIPGAGDQRSFVGVVRVNGLLGGFSQFPLFGKWQHLWHGPFTVDQTEVTALYNAYLEAQTP